YLVGRLEDDPADLEVDLASRLLAEPILAFVDTIGQEGSAGMGLIVHAAELAHAIFRDHAACQPRGVVEITGGAVGDLTEDDLFSNGAAQGDLDLALKLGARHQVAVLLRSAQHVT